MRAGASRARAATTVAIWTSPRTAGPDYLAALRPRCQRPHRPPPTRAGRGGSQLALDLVRTFAACAVLADSLAEIAAESEARHLAANLGKLNRLLDGSGCVVMWIDEPEPAWMRLLKSWGSRAALRQYTALHLSFQQEQWVEQAKGLAGYTAQVRLVKSR